MLNGQRIAIFIEDGFEDLEVIEPMRAMKAVNARVIVVGTGYSQIYRSKSGKRTITAEITADRAKAEDYDAIVIPGDHTMKRMRLYQSVVELVRQAHSLGRVVAAIRHGPQLLISADIVRGHRMTSQPSIALDLRNAGAEWIDAPVVQDRNLITARKPADLPKFIKAIIGAFKD